MENEKKCNNVIKSAIFGTLAGGVMGLLLAPKSGQELRQDLAGQANMMGDKAIEIRDMAQDAWQNIEDRTLVTVNTGKSWIQKGKLMVSNLKTMAFKIRQGALTQNSSIKVCEDKDSVDPT